MMALVNVTNAQVLIFRLLPLLLKIDAAVFEANMTNNSQDITKNQFQRQLTVPLHKLTLLSDTYMEEKYSTFF